MGTAAGASSKARGGCMTQQKKRISGRDGTEARDGSYAFVAPAARTRPHRPVAGEPQSLPAQAPDAGERSFAELLFLVMWPFWLFRDASRGDRLARAAAYRHNRAMRVHLPGYILRWTVGAGLAFGLMAAVESVAGLGEPSSLLLLLAVGLGIVFAGCLCVLLVTGYLYLYLSRNDDAG